MKKKLILVVVAMLTVSFIAIGCGENKENASKEKNNEVTQVNENSKPEVKAETKAEEENGNKITKDDNYGQSKVANIESNKSSSSTNEGSNYKVNSRDSENSNLNNKKSLQSNQESKKTETPVVQAEPTGDYVYVNGGKSKSNKYHKSPTVHKMEGAVKMTREQAESQGYVACKKCY